MNNPSSRKWMCTRFFESETTATDLRNETDWTPAGIDYVCFQLERAPTTDRLHWQMFIHCSRNMRRTQVKRLLPCLGTYEPQIADGTAEQNRTYCTKVESRIEGPWEFGTFPKMGKKETTTAVIEWMAENPDATADDVEVAFPVFCLHNYNKVQDLCFRRKKVRVDFSDFILRPWQKHIVDLLSKPPDDRTIYWVTDLVGRAGKSKLAAFLCETMGATELGGRKQDMAHMYKNHQAPIAIFDVARACTGNLGDMYEFSEKLKDGRLVSTKYCSVSMRIKPLHVIVFSNSSWDRAAYSHDRMVEFNLQTWVPPVEETVVEVPVVTAEQDFHFDADEMDHLLADMFGAAEADRFM